MIARSVVFLIIGLLIFGCLGGQTQTTQEPTPAPTPAPQQTVTPKPTPEPAAPPAPEESMKAQPEFTIEYPTDGGIGIAGKLTVELSIKNFEIAPIGSPNKEGQGHFHLYIDDTGGYVVCASTSCEIEGILPGFHTIKAELHNNDHSLYKPEVVQSVKFFARAG